MLLPLQISEDLGSEKFCVDANQAGAGSWLKYIRVACSCDDQNLAMCQINEQVGLGCSPGFCPCELFVETAPGWSGVKMRVSQVSNKVMGHLLSSVLPQGVAI